MAKLLSKSEIQKMATTIRERHKESAAPSISIRADAVRAAPRATMTLSPNIANPMGEKALYETAPSTKSVSEKGGTPSVPKV